MLVTDQEALEKKALISYDKLFVNGNGTFKQGLVTAIEPEQGSNAGGKVVLESGELVKYDVLILAPGSKYESLLDFPFEEERIREHIEEWRTRFLNAKKVAIIGGGAGGIELAAEIGYYHPGTKVTIVHGDKMLLNSAYPAKYRLDVERRILSRGIELILDDYVDSLPGTTSTTKTITRKGVVIDADLVVPARGGRPNTHWITSSLGRDVATERGYLPIKPTMQLASHPNIFALGDVIDFPEQKQVGKYPVHMAVVAANVATLLQGSATKRI